MIAPTGARPARTVLALGGHAIVGRGHIGTAGEQTATIAAAMAVVAGLVASGGQVVITHGNGPQVGNLLTKNVLARHVVPAMPLHWCVAQTQATIGFAMLTALERELAALGASRPVVPVLSRVLVRADDPAWGEPTKPIGRLVEGAVAAAAVADDPTQRWADTGSAGWRRMVPSPEPVRSLEAGTVRLLLDAGAVVVANGGGGVPVVDDGAGGHVGVEAVVDKDLAGAMLAVELDADALVILTDVEGVAVGYRSDDERWLGEVEAPEVRALAAAHEFGRGSMGPKVEAALRFVEATGRPATIGHLDRAADAIAGRSGTRVVAAGRSAPAP